MVSKNRITLISSLHQKKYRNRYGLFTVEGLKGVKEFLDSSFEPEALYTTQKDILGNTPIAETLVSEPELKKMSNLKTPNKVLGVFKIPQEETLSYEGLIIALDGVRDPGNLGTIIRLCDWFGVRQLVCSKDTVDVYNPKVVQATMGSLGRIKVNYNMFSDILKQTTLPVYGAVMNGENVYKASLPGEGILILGNEANGISEKVHPHIKHKITIPRYGTVQETESLNVATAAAILLSEFRKAAIQM